MAYFVFIKPDKDGSHSTTENSTIKQSEAETPQQKIIGGLLNLEKQLDEGMNFNMYEVKAKRLNAMIDQELAKLPEDDFSKIVRQAQVDYMFAIVIWGGNIENEGEQMPLSFMKLLHERYNLETINYGDEKVLKFIWLHAKVMTQGASKSL